MIMMMIMTMVTVIDNRYNNDVSDNSEEDDHGAIKMIPLSILYNSGNCETQQSMTENIRSSEKNTSRGVWLSTNEENPRISDRKITTN